MRDMERLAALRPAKIAVVRALRGLGDFLTLVPALRALRAALPVARVSLVGLPENGPLVQRFPTYVDELIEFPGFPGIPECEPELARIPGFLTEMQARRFDLALQMHGSGVVTNSFTALLGTGLIAGYYSPGHFCPEPDHFLPYVESEPESGRYIRLLAHLGIPAEGDHLEFPILREDRELFRSIGAAAGLAPGGYVCVHPGSSDPARRWPAERFGRVADVLASHGLRIVLTGSAAEADVVDQVRRVMRHQPVVLAGCTTLGTLAVLLEGANLLLCNDTGVSHLAAALETPSVVVFSGSDPARWAPLDRQRHRALADPVTSARISASQVIDTALEMLPRETRYAA